MNTTIKFPEKYRPSKSIIHVRNHIFIPADKAVIWSWLINAKSWPEWYANSSNVQIVNDEEQKLNLNTKFKWRTFNTNIQSEVLEFKSNEKLAWKATGKGLTAYHSWLILPTEGGCDVITEETQRGWLPKLLRIFIRKGLLKQHQLWLEGLKEKSTQPE